MQTSDPPPTIDDIADQEVGSENTLEVHFQMTSFEGDNVTLTATAENLTDPSTSIASESYAVSDLMSTEGYCSFTFSPTTANFTSGSIRFTITATGGGGSTSDSFTCAVTEGAVKTPPVLSAIGDQEVLARRTLSTQVRYVEADGDEVTLGATGSCHGDYAIDAGGLFTFTPTLDDVADSPIAFTVRATDSDGYDEDSFNVTVTAGSPPAIGTIDAQTVAYDGTNTVTLALTPTDGDEITATNVAVKAGTTAPGGAVSFADLVFSFAPAAADIGQTFTFLATATDFDGTTTNEFTVSVILAAPVLKHCDVEDWTASSLTADIEAAVPGATSYTLRLIHSEADGTPVTNLFTDVAFPYVASGLASTNYVYDVQALCGSTVSAWSSAKSIDLQNYIESTYVIPMTGSSGSYRQDFNGLISTGSAYWYDARTIPGWYAANASGSYSDVQYTASDGSTSETGILSCQVDSEDTSNRALGARADTQYDELSFCVVFTNQCDYAVTNLHVSYKGLEIRQYKNTSVLHFSYARSSSFIELASAENTWNDVDDLDFSAPVEGAAAALDPPETADISADIPFEGDNAIQPGENIALRWYLYAKGNYPSLAIDDLDVTWTCEDPGAMVMVLF